MIVAALRWPGAWLDGLPDQDAHRVQMLLYLVDGALAEAAVSLHLFADAQAALFPSGGASGREQWEAQANARQEVEQAVRAAHPIVAGTAEERWAAEENLRDRVDLAVKHRAWQAGEWPSTYRRTLPFLYAKSFLYALDSMGSAMLSLADELATPGTLVSINADWTGQFPTLRHVRNTSHHQDDRVRGRAQGGKPLPLHPVDNGMISAPGGGALILNSLNGNRYGCTMADGHYGEVDVNAVSLFAARDLAQAALNALSWRGPARWSPM